LEENSKQVREMDSPSDPGRMAEDELPRAAIPFLLW
jgi:hypothetical protein